MVFEKKPAKLKAAMADILENAEADLTPLTRNLIDMLWGEWKTVEQQVDELNDELERISAADAGCTRIRKIQALGRSLRQPSSRRSATAQRSIRAGSSSFASIDVVCS